MEDILLKLEDITKYFPLKSGIFDFQKKYVHAVDNISFEVRKGETFGLVGESGCGKSTTGKVMLKLLEPTAGKILFDGVDITTFNENELRSVRKEAQMIFQDPYSSLNPRMTVGEIIMEPFIIHNIYNKQEREKRAYELLELVGLRPFHAERYPHEFSGGQRQRVGIARALAVNPKLIVCDEPVSALDVSIQAQVLNLMKDLQDKLGLTYIFIAHDLSVVKHICDRIGVMYLGRMVEIAPRDILYKNSYHPYTQALMAAVPIPDPRIRRKKSILHGDIPNPLNPPTGCSFHTRCSHCMDICKKDRPKTRRIEEDHYAACFLDN